MKVSVTDVDAYLRWRSEEDMPLESLLRRLRREDPPTENMMAGRALHAWLERSEPCEVDVFESDGYHFVVECDIALPVLGMRELKATKTYELDGESVPLVGKVDTIIGNRVEDHKTTGQFDAERFLNSFQWKAYLDIFGADHFRWNVFEMRKDTKRIRNYRVTNFHVLDQRRYAGMGDDVRRALADYAHFARQQEIYALSKENRLSGKMG